MLCFRSRWSWRSLQWKDGKQSHGVLHVHHCNSCSLGSDPGSGNSPREPQTEGQHVIHRNKKPGGQQPGRLSGPDQKPLSWEPGAGLLPTGTYHVLLLINTYCHKLAYLLASHITFAFQFIVSLPLCLFIWIPFLRKPVIQTPKLLLVFFRCFLAIWSMPVHQFKRRIKFFFERPPGISREWFIHITRAFS